MGTVCFVGDASLIVKTHGGGNAGGDLLLVPRDEYFGGAHVLSCSITFPDGSRAHLSKISNIHPKTGKPDLYPQGV